MKKQLVWLPAVLLSLTLAGCGDDSTPAPQTTPPPAPANSLMPSLDDPAGGAGATDVATTPSGKPAYDPPKETVESKPMTPAEIAEFGEPSQEGNMVLLGDIRQALDEYYAEYLSYPPTLEQLRKAGFLSHIPKAPEGQKFQIDTTSGEVTLVPR